MIVLGFPDDPALAEALILRLKGLPERERVAVTFEIEKLEDIRAAQRDGLASQAVATFNRRYDVFVLEPVPGPSLIVAQDKRTDRFKLADICATWPRVDFAIAKAAAAFGETVEEQHIWPRR